MLSWVSTPRPAKHEIFLKVPTLTLGMKCKAQLRTTCSVTGKLPAGDVTKKSSGLDFVIRGAIACWELCAPAKGLLGNVVSCTLGAVVSDCHRSQLGLSLDNVKHLN